MFFNKYVVVELQSLEFEGITKVTVFPKIFTHKLSIEEYVNEYIKTKFNVDNTRPIESISMHDKSTTIQYDFEIHTIEEMEE